MQRASLTARPTQLLAWAMAAVVVVCATRALAADPSVEREARALQKKAIEDDSLNLNYPEAIKKLATAISRCGEDRCAVGLKAALYRDLGAVLALSGSVDEGRAAFLKALSFDPSLELDPAYKTPQLEQLWREAKKKAGATSSPSAPGAPSAPAGGTATGGAGGPPPGAGGAAGPTSLPPSTNMPPSAGDFAHVPAGAQLVRTPLPIYAEYLGSEKLRRVVVRYKGAGMSDWRSIDLRPMGSGYGGLIPCRDVTEGPMQYYIEGYASSDAPVASSGSQSTPYTVPIQAQLSGPAPTLPGQEPPVQCPGAPPPSEGALKADGAECSADAECKSSSCSGGRCVERGGEGDECDEDSDCASGTCADGKCTAPKKLTGDECSADDECASGRCDDGRCSEGHRLKAPRMWVGVGASLDFMVLPSAQNVCVLNATTNPPSPSSAYECVDPATGQNFPGRDAALNTSIALNQGDSVLGGLVPGNLRFFASFDYALTMNVLLGARAGYVLFTDPANAPGPAFAPIHLEARATLLLGKDALAKTIAPMLFAAGGVGEFDASFGVQVLTNGSNGATTKNENAWIVAGPAFGAVGVGARFLLAPNLAATVAMKGEGAFGGTAGFLGGIAPELGMQLGL